MARLFVGDVQGCADELDELLARAERELGPDYELWQVGDLVNRGPENLRVLRRVRELHAAGRARVVLGNHDLALVMSHLGLREPKATDTFRDVLEAPDVEDWIEWLRRLPLVECGEIAGQRFAMVHAAVHPQWGLEALRAGARRIEKRLGAEDRQAARRLLAAEPARDPDAALLARLTRCRSVPEPSRWSSEPPAHPDQAWHAVWTRAGHDFGVVYGHWSLQRLHVAPGLRGLDTGCVHHLRGADGFLTAWVPGDEPRPDGLRAFDVPDDRFWQVKARRQYYGLP